LNVIKAGHLLKSRMLHASGDLARLGWTAPRPEALPHNIQRHHLTEA